MNLLQRLLAFFGILKGSRASGNTPQIDPFHLDSEWIDMPHIELWPPEFESTSDVSRTGNGAPPKNASAAVTETEKSITLETEPEPPMPRKGAACTVSYDRSGKPKKARYRSHEGVDLTARVLTIENEEATLSRNGGSPFKRRLTA